jgi:hypothetical protein
LRLVAQIRHRSLLGWVTPQDDGIGNAAL